jgi:hypothetical protein
MVLEAGYERAIGYSQLDIGETSARDAEGAGKKRCSSLQGKMWNSSTVLRSGSGV